MKYGPLPHQRDRPGDHDDSRGARPRVSHGRPGVSHGRPGDGRRPTPYAFPPARSALGLRRILALFGLVVCGVAAAWLAAVDWPLPAALLALLALVAVVDLAVIQFRIRQLSRGRRR